MTMTNQEKFIKQLRASGSIDFVLVAREAGLDFTRDVYRVMQSDPAFLEQVNAVLQEVKYDLLNKLLEVARSGKSQYGAKPDAAAIKAVIMAIDSGVLTRPLGEVRAQAGDDGEIRRRLGIEGSNNDD